METLLRPDVTRIVLTGSESTGKTTLAAALADHYGVEWVPEFVREFAAEKGRPIAMSDHGPIARGQMALEHAFSERAGTLLFQDADLLSTVVYCHHYFGGCPGWIEDAAVSRRPALYLLATTDVPWVADGLRDRGERREEMHTLFVETLERLNARYEIIDGLGAERLRSAVLAVDALLTVQHSGQV